MTYNSLSLIVTGSSFNPHTQAFSHKAGQTRPVNSGKQFVFNNLASACFSLPRYISSFHSGIKLCKGHPETVPFIEMAD